MLSMINPDSMTRFESQAKFSTSNMMHGQPTVHETYYEQHMEASGEKHHGKVAKSSMLNFPQTKTMANFYPGPLGSVDEQRSGLKTAQDQRARPTSAKVKKNIPVSCCRR